MDKNLVDNLVNYFSPQAGLKRSQYRAAQKVVDKYQRKYEGASKGRRTKNWKVSSSSAEAEIKGSLVTLRNRSRQLIRDNPYANKGVQVISSNVVGKGIFTQIKVDSGQQQNITSPNKLAERRELEFSRRWKAWAGTTAIDYDGRNNFAGIQRLVMRSVVESGEVLIRRRRSLARTIKTDEGFQIDVPPIQLQVLESDFLNGNLSITSEAENDNVIVQGIEFNKKGQRVAYHLFEEHPGNSSSGFSLSIKTPFRTVRVLAEDILHIYRLDRPGQIRGVPWTAPVMIRLRDFDEYEEAQLVRQKIAACFAVFIKDMEGVPLGEEEGTDGLNGEKIEPGIMEILPPGKDITLADPPGVEGYDVYTRTVLHAVSTGLGITYSSLTGDLSQVNFSSSRVGLLEMNRNVDEWRSNIIRPQLLQPTFKWWLEGIDLMGLDTTRVRAIHTSPRRDAVDPKKQADAETTDVRGGIVS